MTISSPSFQTWRRTMPSPPFMTRFQKKTRVPSAKRSPCPVRGVLDDTRSEPGIGHGELARVELAGVGRLLELFLGRLGGCWLRGGYLDDRGT